MGRKRENPRYNVLSLRLSDDELEVIQLAAGDDKLSDYTRNLLITGSVDALVRAVRHRPARRLGACAADAGNITLERHRSRFSRYGGQRWLDIQGE